MTWLRLDDGMLDHPKWIRAITLGGDEVVTVWLRLLSWCSRNLTDGLIPGDMVAQVAQLKAGAKRAKALRALEEARLITRGEGEEIVMVDYLERNPSASQVRADRERKIEAQRKRRLGGNEAGLHSMSEAGACSVPSHPIPIPSHSEREERALGNDTEPEQTETPTHIQIPEAWKVSEEFFAEAYAAGVTRNGLEEAVTYWRGRKLGGEWFSIEAFFRGKFASIKIREEKTRFAAQQERKAQSSPRASPGGFGSDLDTTGAALAFHASDDDRKFALGHALDLDRAVRDYRASQRAAALDTPTQRRDFSNRLKCWHATGQWIVDGALPKNPVPKRRATEAA